MTLDTTIVPRVVIDVASAHPGVSDIYLRQAFVRASRFLFGGKDPSVDFYNTGEIRGSRSVSEEAERSGLVRIAAAMRLYMKLPEGASLEWFSFDSRYCLRALEPGRMAETGLDLARRFQPEQYD